VGTDMESVGFVWRVEHHGHEAMDAPRETKLPGRAVEKVSGRNHSSVRRAALRS
jgi:hypothetical protein